jgi:hypothetical protein
MESTKKLTNLQLELLKIFRFDLSDKQLKEIKSILVAYFAEKVTKDIDKLFEEQDWGEEKIEEWSKEHLRTKYEKE